MFSVKPPRRRTATLPPMGVSSMSSSSNHRMDDDYRSGDIDQSSVRSGGWSLSASTLDDGFLAAVPSRYSHSVGATRVSHRHRHNAFSCEVPEDPLRAAIGLESVLEHPISPIHDAGSDDVVAHSLLDFSRRQVSSIKPHKSALSAMVSSKPVANPFAALLAGVEATDSFFKIRVYFPHAEQPYGQLLDLTLPANATVEDAITAGLFWYWERRWLPELDAAKTRDTDIASWIMLVPGKDGVVNKRIAQNKIARFNVDECAIVRSPRSLAEKQKIQRQVTKFRLVSPPLVTNTDKRHARQNSLPVFKSASKGPDAPVSLSILP
ncbi:hypothetical protein DFH07DRAFT_1058629 [Mycena maculata]|uniref:CRIM domain-containing protein n=1 Tax=Mycena maculata TaxID=230809 RepID=A0AAD7NLW1_9AGAR|nr:hypothetical protein DFH07DRAFT_1058629 [Mycena maculata]